MTPFKIATRQGIEKIRNILSLEIENPSDLKRFDDDKIKFLRKTHLAKDPKKILSDAWGEEFKVALKDDDIIVTSKHLQANGKVSPPN